MVMNYVRKNFTFQVRIYIFNPSNPDINKVLQQQFQGEIKFMKQISVFFCVLYFLYRQIYMLEA